MSKPTGKLAFAYQTIARMEERIEALIAENETLRGLYKMHQQTETREMLDLRAERDALNELLRGVYPQLCARRDEQDLDDAQQYVLAEECQELIDGIDAALQGEQP